eukprot:6050715-Pyramimonas_sp.AAC.1
MSPRRCRCPGVPLGDKSLSVPVSRAKPSSTARAALFAGRAAAGAAGVVGLPGSTCLRWHLSLP